MSFVTASSGVRARGGGKLTTPQIIAMQEGRRAKRDFAISQGWKGKGRMSRFTAGYRLAYPKKRYSNYQRHPLLPGQRLAILAKGHAARLAKQAAADRAGYYALPKSQRKGRYNELAMVGGWSKAPKRKAGKFITDYGEMPGLVGGGGGGALSLGPMSMRADAANLASIQNLLLPKVPRRPKGYASRTNVSNSMAGITGGFQGF